MTTRMVLGLLTIFGTGVLPAQQASKVGTFDTPSIVVAYYRSELWEKTLREKSNAIKAAKAAGDSDKVAELEKWGSASQELAHKQLAGQAPIDNIIEALRPHFAGIAAAAGVREIVPAAKGTPGVDVTNLLLDVLKADERTRKTVRELRK